MKIPHLSKLFEYKLHISMEMKIQIVHFYANPSKTLRIFFYEDKFFFLFFLLLLCVFIIQVVTRGKEEDTKKRTKKQNNFKLAQNYMQNAIFKKKSNTH